MTQRAIPATFMRGGTSKGVFFLAEDLPPAGPARDALLLRVTGSPDRYGKQIDGMGGASSSTSKVVLLSRSRRADCDVDYLFGAVSIDAPVIDWSGNCGNLSAAVGPFAIHSGLVDTERSGEHTTVRIWQANIGKRIVSRVPTRDGRVVEEGDFELDGVSFPSAEIRLDFMDPAGDDNGALLPTGHTIDQLDVPGLGPIEATLITAGNPTVVVEASALGLRGDELQPEVNGNAALLQRCEALRAFAAVRMGLAASTEEASRSRPATPKLAFISAPKDYTASDGRRISADQADLTVRIFSMGLLHHALTGTGAVTFGVAAALPGTLIARCIRRGWTSDRPLRLAHPAGTLSVGAEAHEVDGVWSVTRISVSRSARRLMTGTVFVPELAR